MYTIKFLITRLEDSVKLTVLSFRDDGSFASGQARTFVGQPTDEEVIAYGSKLLAPGIEGVDIIDSLDGLGLTDGDISIIANMESLESNINDDPSTSVDESVAEEIV